LGIWSEGELKVSGEAEEELTIAVLMPVEVIAWELADDRFEL
jgi:hypothetical protein